MSTPLNDVINCQLQIISLIEASLSQSGQRACVASFTLLHLNEVWSVSLFTLIVFVHFGTVLWYACLIRLTSNYFWRTATANTYII